MVNKQIRKARKKMSHSLRAKIKCLRYKGIITDKECDRLRKALDNEDALDKIRAEIDKELFTYSQEVENMGDSAQKIRISLGIVRKIIDKYRKEQE